MFIHWPCSRYPTSGIQHRGGSIEKHFHKILTRQSLKWLILLFYLFLDISLHLTLKPVCTMKSFLRECYAEYYQAELYTLAYDDHGLLLIEFR
ncbi:hypothetical protein IQ07DRAFT_77348 [Pyrenochaeta sp. DS3sAY3a]|nr:hypothetical protein IQ07DRAFT_77348 [Pyrenochaeta sp. DS3sAY3a]